MQHYECTLLADYFQFYLQDEVADGDLSDSWTPEAVARMLAVAPGAVGVGTARNMRVPVSIEIHEREPLLDAGSWDHVAECSLVTRAGRVVIAGCSDYFPDAARVDVAPGTYCVRVSYGALKSVSEDGLDGLDHYTLQLWKAPPIEPRVLKQHAA